MRAFRAIHLLLLGGIIGIELFLGIVVAKAIFYPSEAVSLDIFQSGLIMGVIFYKFGWVLVAITLLNAIYEVLAKSTPKMKYSKIILSCIIFILALVFHFYFTAYILDAQAMGAEAIASQKFTMMHKASEWTMKLLCIVQLVLFFLNFAPQKCNK